MHQAGDPVTKNIAALLAMASACTLGATETDGRQTTPKAELVDLWRLDCGSFPDFPIEILSDDDRYRGQHRTLTNGCYLIKHGADYMLWDAGLPVEPAGTAKRSIIDQISQIGVKPQQIRYLGVSHLHPDHISQASAFSAATLLIGEKEWLTAKSPPPWLDVSPLQPWLSGGSHIELLTQFDKDVFGDGTVRIIATPGHTPGHRSLIIVLRQFGVVMLTGDLFHLRESYDHNVIPSENDNRADTLASIERFKAIAHRYKAIVIIQHEPTDVAKLPAFPASAH